MKYLEFIHLTRNDIWDIYQEFKQLNIQKKKTTTENPMVMKKQTEWIDMTQIHRNRGSPLTYGKVKSKPWSSSSLLFELFPDPIIPLLKMIWGGEDIFQQCVGKVAFIRESVDLQWWPRDRKEKRKKVPSEQWASLPSFKMTFKM